MNLPVLQKLPYPPADKTGWPWTQPSETVIATQRTYPKISIVTPSYNQGQYLEETIRSVLLQQYPNLEYIIIDGGSTDNSLDIIKKYEPWITYWISEPDSGQSEAINKGFKKCTGDIVTWLCSDDLITFNALFTVADAYLQSEWAVLSGTCTMFYEGSDKTMKLDSGPITFNSLLETWRMHFCPPQPAMFIRKKILDNVGLLNENLKFVMDYELWLRISREYRFAYINHNLALYRVHDQSKTGSTGGMRKFYPEWKKVRDKYLSEASVRQKITYHFSFYRHHVPTTILFYINKKHRGLKKRFTSALEYIQARNHIW